MWLGRRRKEPSDGKEEGREPPDVSPGFGSAPWLTFGLGNRFLEVGWVCLLTFLGIVN